MVYARVYRVILCMFAVLTAVACFSFLSRTLTCSKAFPNISVAHCFLPKHRQISLQFKNKIQSVRPTTSHRAARTTLRRVCLLSL